MFFAQVLGSLTALMSDIVVIVPALIVGAIATSWRNLIISFAVALAVILTFKLPAIVRVAEMLSLPNPSLEAYSLWYAAAISVWVGIVFVVRRVFSGNWPISRV